MSEFDSAVFQLDDTMLQGKSMYVFFLNKGIDISQPQPTTEIYDLVHFYQRETGLLPYRYTFTPNREGQYYTATESRVFRPGYDVQINRHANYSIVPIHAHEYFEILLTVKGDYTVWFDETPVHQSAGDLLIIPPYVVHTNRVFTDGCLTFSMSLRLSTLRQHFPVLFMREQMLGDFLGRSYDHASEPRTLLFHTGSYLQGDNSIADLYAEYQRGEEYSAERCNLHAMDFFLTLLQRYAADAEELHFTSTRPQVETLITQYIREHAESVTLPELSRKFSYSERHITRLIRQSSGMSYSQLVRKIRMEAIGEMVSDPTLPIEQIISDCGMSSPSYFYKTFRAYFGMTPKEYRERTGQGGRSAV